MQAERTNFAGDYDGRPPINAGTNMVGGNVKGGFGEHADLSLPTVGEARNWLNRLPQGSLRTTFECYGDPLTIVLHEVVTKPTQVDAMVAI